MKKGVVFVLLAVLFLPMAGCNADKSLVEDEEEFVPYWWRDDPDFKDKNIDEDATNALGIPHFVVIVNEDQEEQDMYRKFTEEINERYGEKNIPHFRSCSSLAWFMYAPCCPFLSGSGHQDHLG